MRAPAEFGQSASEAALRWRQDIIALIPTLRAFGLSLSRNADDADDLVQDTIVKAWTHRDKFTPGTSLRAWMFTILRNTFYTQAVRRKREVRDEDGAMSGALSTPASQEWSLEVDALRLALQKLPKEHREAIVLVAAAGLTYEEAAIVIGCAVGTIKSRINRARTLLTRILAEDIEELFPHRLAHPRPPADPAQPDTGGA